MKLLLAGGALAALLLSVSAAPAAADGMPRQRAHRPAAPAARPAPPRRHHAPAQAPHAQDDGYGGHAPYVGDEEQAGGYARRYHREDVEVTESDTGWVGDEEAVDAFRGDRGYAHRYERRERHDGGGDVFMFRGGPQRFEQRLERREHHGGDRYGHGDGRHRDHDGGYDERYEEHGEAGPYEYGYGSWAGYYAGGWRLAGERYGHDSYGPDCREHAYANGYARRCVAGQAATVLLPHGYGDQGVGFGVADGAVWGGGGGTVIVDSRAGASASAFARSNAFAYGRGGHGCVGCGGHGRPSMHHGGGHRPTGHHGGGRHGGGRSGGH